MCGVARVVLLSRRFVVPRCLCGSRAVSRVHRLVDGPYELRTAFPARAYTDLSETLRDARLIPSAALFLRNV